MKGNVVGQGGVKVTGEQIVRVKLGEAVVNGDPIYLQEDFDFTQLTNPATMPAHAYSKMEYSPDSQYLAMINSTGTFVRVYKRVGDVYTNLTIPQPASYPTDIKWSPNGIYLAMALPSSPRVYVYKRTGDTFTKIADPSSIPVVTGNTVAFNDLSNRIVLGCGGSPWLEWFSLENDIITKYTTGITGAPTANPYVVKYSPDGKKLVVGCATDLIKCYVANIGSLTAISPPNDISNGGAGNQDIAMTKDSRYAFIGKSSSPHFMKISIEYGASSQMFHRLYEPYEAPVNTIFALSLSPSNRYLFTSGQTTPYCEIFDDADNTDYIKKITWKGSRPVVACNGSRLSPDGKHFAVCLSGSPYLAIYKNNAKPLCYKHEFGDNVKFTIGYGYAKSSGSINAEIDVVVTSPLI